MTFTEFVTVTAPSSCGVHASFGRVVELVIADELADAPAFSSEAFETTRERAQLAAPYPDVNGNRERVLDLIELAICNHRQAHHGEDHRDRIEYLLAQPMSDDAKEMATREWWNQ